MHSDQKPNSSHHCLPWLACVSLRCSSCTAPDSESPGQQRFPGSGSQGCSVPPTAHGQHFSHHTHHTLWLGNCFSHPLFPIQHFTHVPDLGGVKSCGNTFTGTGLLFIYFFKIFFNQLIPSDLYDQEISETVDLLRRGKKESEPKISLKWWSLTGVAEG